MSWLEKGRKPKFTGRRSRPGGTLCCKLMSSCAARATFWTRASVRVNRRRPYAESAIGRGRRGRSVRESMRRLLRSLGYAAEAFPSAADFLASPRLGETACLIADLHMPAMTGLELHRRVIDMGMQFQRSS